MATTNITPQPSVNEPFVDSERKIVLAWLNWLRSQLASIVSSIVGGITGSVQYNDGGKLGGDSNFTWKKTDGTLTVTSNGSSFASPLITNTQGARVSGGSGPIGNATLIFGGVQDATGNDIPDGSSIGYAFMQSNPAFSPGNQRFGFELDYGLTAGTPDPFSAGIDAFLVAPTETTGSPVNAWIVDTFGGAAADPGMALLAFRNGAGSGASGSVGGTRADGTLWVIWQDQFGDMRFGAARPTANGSVSDTSGNVFAGPSAITILKSIVTLTDAQIKALPTTPVTIIPAQGASTVIEPLQYIVQSKCAAGAYTNVNAAAFGGMSYGPASGTASGYIANDPTTTPVLSFLTQMLGTTPKQMILLPYMTQVDPASDEWGVFGDIPPSGPIANLPVQLVMNNQGSGNFTGGNAANTWVVTAFYTVLPA